MSVWKNIDSLMRKNGVSSKKLAYIAGVGPSAVTKWKSGSSIRNDAISRIAVHFGVSIDWLMGSDHSDEIAQVRETPAVYSTAADRPAESADASRLDEVVNRLDKMQTQIDTVIRLLGHRLK